MDENHRALLVEILDIEPAELLDRWLEVQSGHDLAIERPRGDAPLRAQGRMMLDALRAALVTDDPTQWQELHSLLERIAHRHAHGGATFEQTGLFLTAFKRPLFERAAAKLQPGSPLLVELLWSITVLLDDLVLKSTRTFMTERDLVIARQRADLEELSSPVLKLWDDIIVMPLVGTLDSRRAQVVMEALLNAVEHHGASVAILDITGVQTVDTQVAQNLFRTAAAARLMGTDCIISGIGPQVAQTIVELGIDFGNLKTRSSLSDAIRSAFTTVGLKVTRTER